MKARMGTNDARPAFQRMISDAKSGAFRYIIVYMFDRFARNRRAVFFGVARGGALPLKVSFTYKKIYPVVRLLPLGSCRKTLL